MAEKAIQFENLSKTLLRHLHDNYVDWMHACGGKGRCTTCKAIIITGSANLGDLTPVEEQYSSNGELNAGERLACQCVVQGDVTVYVPPESQLPHVSYTS